VQTLIVLAMVTVTAGSAAAAAQQPPSITVLPTCIDQRPLRTRITVSGRNFPPDFDVRAIFDSGRADQDMDRAVTDNDGSFAISDLVTAELDPDPVIGGYRIRVDLIQAEESMTTVFRVPCPQPPRTTTTQPGTTTTTTEPPQVFTPTLTIDPAVGPPGFVATATGTGWPTGPVTIGTSAGGQPITAVADSGGGFRVSVLVYPGTSLGQLGVQGTGAGGVTATGTFLVVPRGVEPPIWNR
jgi:hypothetical protein